MLGAKVSPVKWISFIIIMNWFITIAINVWSYNFPIKYGVHIKLFTRITFSVRLRFVVKVRIIEK